MSKTTRRILFLGYGRGETSLIDALEKKGCSVESTSDRVESISDYELVICFGYRHILSCETLGSTSAPVINLHISYLPWNRGAHPNFWSFFDETPKGVTIHLIDRGLDTGPILWQEEVQFQAHHLTFRQTQQHLINKVEKLFIKNINKVLTFDFNPIQQEGGGTYHRLSELPAGFSGWDSSIEGEIEKLKKSQSEKRRD